MADNSEMDAIKRSLEEIKRNLDIAESRWKTKDKLGLGQKNSPELERQIDLLKTRKNELEQKQRQLERVESEVAGKISEAVKGKGNEKTEAKMQGDPGGDSLKRREEELRIKALEDEAEDRERRLAEEEEERKKREEEERKRNKWGKTKKFIGGTRKVVGGVRTYSGAGGGWIVFIFAWVVWIVDWRTRFDGIRLDMFLERVSLGAISLRVPGIPLFARETLWALLINPVFWIPIIAYAIIKVRSERRFIGDVGSFMALVYFPLVIFFLGGYSGSSLLHLGMAGAFYALILKDYFGEEGLQKARIAFVIFLLIDFFGYGILKEVFLSAGYFTNRLAVPMWVLLSLWFIHRMNRRADKSTKLTSALWIIVIVFYSFMAVTALPVPLVDLTKEAGPEMTEEAVQAGRMFTDNFKNWVTQLFTDIKTSAAQQMEYATGGYYNGKVEENEDPNNRLGVYLENVEAADKNFFENEQAVIWGDLKARTLDQPIYVYISCESGDVKGRVFPETLANPGYFENPEKGYKIEQLEQIGFECRFDSGTLKTGSNLIKIKAEFNFETLAFLKTYFMDIERVRALRRESIDPLTQYGIKDKTPTAVFTNGPVKLGIGTVDPPVGVNAEENAYSYIGVTLERQWIGRIKNVTEITIQVPSKIQAEEVNDLFCRGDFKKTGEDEEGYSVYTLTGDALNKIKTPITDFRSWRCSLTVPKASEVLEKNPVTLYYYRANAKYIYEIEKQIGIYIKSVPKEKTKITDCDVNCTDSDGCVCDADGCNMVKGSEVGYGYTCNNYFGGCSNKGRTIEQDLGYIDALQQYIGAMIYLNQRCLQGDTKIINESIDGSKDMDEKMKKELKDSIMEGCEKRSYRFFEITEELIIKRARCGVDIFNVLKNKKLEDRTGEVKIKKDEFDALLATVIEHFRENYDYVTTGKSNENIKKAEEERERLKNINFD